jgi:integrase
VFLYRDVIADAIAQDHLGWFELMRSRRPARVPTVLSAAEVARVIEAVPERRIDRLLVPLLYGTRLRITECCTRRVRDIALERAQIIVRGGKGDKDRVVMLPATLAGQLAAQIDAVATRAGERRWPAGGYAPVPDALANKRSTAAPELPAAVGRAVTATGRAAAFASRGSGH